MTNEEAVEIIKECKEKGFKHTFYTLNEYHTALDMAIKALEQQLCEDAISRQMALDLCERFDGCVPYSVLSNHDMLPSVSTENPNRCGDAVSRELVKKDIARWIGYIDEDMIARMHITINKLPSVSTEKTGRWILKRTSPTKLYDEHLKEYKCSECYRGIRCTESQLVNYPYCHCGARMEVEE